MAAASTIAQAPAPTASEAADYRSVSLWNGDPADRALRCVHLSGSDLDWLARRAAVAVALAWLPLLLLTVLSGNAWSGVALPFLADIETQTRLLVALPLLIAGEVVIHRRMPGAIQQFVDRRIVGAAARERFDAAAASAARWSRSALSLVLIAVFVYTVGLGLGWKHMELLHVTTWYRAAPGAPEALTTAGWWYLLVSLPLLQFVLFRWYCRLFIWARFLWQVSRLDLTLVPTHPDRCAGLGFLKGLAHAFAPFLLAHGVLLAGSIAEGIFYAGRSLADYRWELIAVPVVMALLVLGPSLAFCDRLWNARRIGSRQYGELAQRYVLEFHGKWLLGERPAGEPLIGSADIQSLADLANSFEIIDGMRFAPLDRKVVLRVAIATLVPTAPLLFTVIPASQLAEKLLKILF